MYLLAGLVAGAGLALAARWWRSRRGVVFVPDRSAAVRTGCVRCDGTGCPCMRWRDWQTMADGCDCGCSACGVRPGPEAE